MPKKIRGVTRTTPVEVTVTDNEMLSYSFGVRDDDVEVCVASWLVPRADGSLVIEHVTIENPVASGVIPRGQWNTIADAVRDQTKDLLR